MDKELCKEVISFIESLPNSDKKYELLRKLYLDEAGLNKNKKEIPIVNAIRTIDEVTRRIFVGDLSINAARSFSQTEECDNLLRKGM